MTEKPEALRLAELWEKHSHGYALTPEAMTAAELRRLAAVEAQRDALLEALRPFVTISSGFDMDDVWRALAAIKAVEEQK